MGLRIDKARAERLVRSAAGAVEQRSLNLVWVDKVKELSRLCEEAGTKTHIAFLGTSILAKAMHQDVDLFAIKPRHAESNPNAYSARSLCHSVLVPLAADLGFSMGVTGREPLNNQPYFRMVRLGDSTPVHPRGRAAFDYMVTLVGELQDLSNRGEAQEALSAFIYVRRSYLPSYFVAHGTPDITPRRLVKSAQTFVQNESEHGKRAQAIVAGLMDAFAGRDRVISGRVNDPSHRHPGDVCIRALTRRSGWEKAFEVRDKPVSLADVQIFARKCSEMDVQEAAMVAVSEHQPSLDLQRLATWSARFRIGITVFLGWESIVEQALFWSPDPKLITARRAARSIIDRLIDVEAKPESVKFWIDLTR